MAMSEITKLLKGNKILSEYEISWIPQLIMEINVATIRESLAVERITDAMTGDQLLAIFTQLSSDVQEKILQTVIIGKEETPEDIVLDTQRFKLNLFKTTSYLVLVVFVVLIVVVCFIAISKRESIDAGIMNSFFTLFFDYIKVIITGGS